MTNETISISSNIITDIGSSIGEVSIDLLITILSYMPHAYGGYKVLAGSLSNTIGHPELEVGMSYLLLMISGAVFYKATERLGRGLSQLLYIIGGIVIVSLAIYLLKG